MQLTVISICVKSGYKSTSNGTRSFQLGQKIFLHSLQLLYDDNLRVILQENEFLIPTIWMECLLFELFPTTNEFFNLYRNSEVNNAQEENIFV